MPSRGVHPIRTPSDVVVVSELATPQMREVRFSTVDAGAVDAVALLVIDPPHGESGVQRVPGLALSFSGIAFEVLCVGPKGFPT
jgi:hypothetical protein